MLMQLIKNVEIMFDNKTNSVFLSVLSGWQFG